MKKGRFLEVLLFISGLGLSLITNLFTGDGDVVNFYESNKELVLYTGLGLTVLSIILSYNSQSEEANVGKSGGISPFKFIGRILLSGIFNLGGGLLAGVIFIWFFGLFNMNSEATLRIITIMSGAAIGTQFKYIYGNEFIGAVTGGFIGFATSYYFTPDFQLDFLPAWLNKAPAISSGIVGGAIGLFTAIFEVDYNNRIKRAEKEELKEIEPKLEKYELAVAMLKSKNLAVHSSDLEDSFWSMAQNMMAIEKKEGREENGKTVQEELTEARRKLGSNTQVAILKTLYKWAFGTNKTTLPRPPYKVFNKYGEELHTFTSINALHQFALNYQPK